jgi:hypothetical protein
MSGRYQRKLPRTARDVTTSAKKIAREIIDSDRNAGTSYVDELLSGDRSLSELFERKIPLMVKLQMWRMLELYEETRVYP